LNQCIRSPAETFASLVARKRELLLHELIEIAKQFVGLTAEGFGDRPDIIAPNLQSNGDYLDRPTVHDEFAGSLAVTVAGSSICGGNGASQTNPSSVSTRLGVESASTESPSAVYGEPSMK